MSLPVTMYLWWILSNGIIAYFSIDFFLRMTRTDGSDQIPLLLAITAVLTAVATRLQISGTFWLEIPLWMVYAVAFMKIRWMDLLAPFAVLFTLRTFVEGFTAVLTAYTAAHLNLSSDGTWVQIFLSLSLNILFVLILRLIQKRFAFSLQKSIPSCLYALLLPCALMILAIRYELRLDSSAFAQYLSSFSMGVSLTTLSLIIGAAIVFLVIIETFCKVIRLEEQEAAAALLTRQLAGQQMYLKEAKTQNEQYASLQHDMKNHLLVLSGLIRQAKYAAAEQYAANLQASCRSFPLPVSTGNLVLDTLFMEKLSDARRKGIQVDCRVRIPSGFQAEDMDLCILFSNILDNAITACMQVEQSKRVLRISTKVRSHFLVLESANSTAVSRPVQKGIGLRNIEHISRKYQGATEIECADGMFRLRVLLCSPKKADCE